MRSPRSVRRFLLSFVLLAIASSCTSEPGKQAAASTPPTATAATTRPISDSSKALVALDGFGYVPIPAQLETTIRGQVAGNPFMSENLQNLAMRSITKNGEGTAAIMVFVLKPSASAVVELFEPSIAKDFSGSDDAPLEITLAGRRAYYFPNLRQLMWSQRSAMFLLLGPDRTELETIAELLIKGNS
jgi:hypothetical protein